MKCPCTHDKPEPFHRESWQRKWNAAFDKLPQSLQDEIMRDPKGPAAHNFNQLLMKRNPVKSRKIITVHREPLINGGHWIADVEGYLAARDLDKSKAIEKVKSKIRHHYPGVSIIVRENPVKRRKKMGSPWRFVKGAKPGFRKLKNIRTGKVRLIRMGARKTLKNPVPPGKIKRSVRNLKQAEVPLVVTVSYRIVRGAAKAYPYWGAAIYYAELGTSGESTWRLLRTAKTPDRRSERLAVKDAIEVSEILGIPFKKKIRHGFRSEMLSKKTVDMLRDYRYSLDNPTNPVTVRRHRGNPQRQERVIVLPPGNIYWRNIPRNARVEDFESGWVYDNKTVFWHGNEAMEAQQWLRQHSGSRKIVSFNKRNPVTVRRLASGKFRVRTPRHVHAYGTTKARATRQARLIRAVEHGWRPTGQPALAVRKKLKAMRKPARVGHRLFAHRKGKHWTLRTAPRGGLVIAKHLTLEQLRSRARKLSYKIRSL